MLFACMNNVPEAVEVLSTFSEIENTRDDQGYTNLMWASMLGYTKVIKSLLKVS